MKRILFTLFLIFSSFAISFSQNKINVPLNIKKAYLNATRDSSGRPGKKYWQNSSDYKIFINANPYSGEFLGEENIRYYNNSPDTLSEIVIRLYQDFNKFSNPRTSEIQKEYLTEGTLIYSITINKNQIDLENKKEFSRYGTNAKINLPEKIFPRESADINISWKFKIPDKFTFRMGNYDINTYHIAYFYPQISVYDDIDGWDIVNYSGAVEFYNDFNNYDVTIEVPNTFAVWATGLLENPQDVLNSKFLKRFEEAKQSDNVINIIKKEDYSENNIFNRKSEINTWNFRAFNVPDFCFSISDRYLWDGVNYRTKDGRNVFICSAYRESSKDFYDVAKLAKEVIKRLSEDFPGVPFPFPAMTVFNGGGGMEFPMMVNNSSEDNFSGTVHLTSHEITHTYFPFYMGINERKYAFMDEGWAVMIPYDMQSELAKGYDPRLRGIKQFTQYAGTEYDLPVITPSHLILNYAVYRNNAYNKPAMAYYFLKEAIGKDAFRNALIKYIEIWNGKHPTPYDFFNLFNAELNINLNDYWDNWFFKTNYPDQSIGDINVTGNQVEIKVINKGGLYLPVHLKMNYADGSYEETDFPITEWLNNPSMLNIKINSKNKLISVFLGADWIPEKDYSDNFVEIK